MPRGHVEYYFAIFYELGRYTFGSHWKPIGCFHCQVDAEALGLIRITNNTVFDLSFYLK